jgi:hypothetical protein
MSQEVNVRSITLRPGVNRVQFPATEPQMVGVGCENGQVKLYVVAALGDDESPTRTFAVVTAGTRVTGTYAGSALPPTGPALHVFCQGE